MNTYTPSLPKIDRFYSIEITTEIKTFHDLRGDDCFFGEIGLDYSKTLITLLKHSLINKNSAVDLIYLAVNDLIDILKFEKYKMSLINNERIEIFNAGKERIKLNSITDKSTRQYKYNLSSDKIFTSSFMIKATKYDPDVHTYYQIKENLILDNKLHSQYVSLAFVKIRTYKISELNDIIHKNNIRSYFNSVDIRINTLWKQIHNLFD